MNTNLSRLSAAAVLAVSLCAAPAQETPAARDGSADVIGFLQQVHGFLQPEGGQLPAPVAFDLRFRDATGGLKKLNAQTIHITAQSLDRVKISGEIDGRKFTVCRNGESLWIHAPKKNLLVIGEASVPRFPGKPESVSDAQIGRISLPLNAAQLALLPAAVVVKTKSENGGTVYELSSGPIAEKAGIKGKLSAFVPGGTAVPSQLTWIDGETRLTADIVVSGEPIADAAWQPAPEPDDKVERVALSHLTKFATVMLRSIGSKIPELGPVKGERKLEAVAGKGRLEIHDGTRVLFLEGTAEEMGTQHGTLMKPWVRGVVDRILYGVGVASSFEKGRWFFDEIDEALRRTGPHVDSRYFTELESLATAAGVEKEEARMANFFPELFHCSGFALHGKSTVDGKMYHGRVLDYLRGQGLEENAVVIVSKPAWGHAWVNLGYAGFTGSVTAMNEKHIAIGEMGGRGEGSWDGMPMAQLVRAVMEQADTVEEAVEIMRKTPRTCEYYYVISDAKSGRACGLKTTPDIFEVVWSGQSHPQLTDPVEDTVLMSGGDRYKELVRRVKAGFGTFSADSARALMDRPVCMTSNIQSVLFEPGSLDFWVANADTDSVASEARYTKYNLRTLLDSQPATAGE